MHQTSETLVLGAGHTAKTTPEQVSETYVSKVEDLLKAALEGETAQEKCMDEATIFLMVTTIRGLSSTQREQALSHIVSCSSCRQTFGNFHRLHSMSQKQNGIHRFSLLNWLSLSYKNARTPALCGVVIVLFFTGYIIGRSGTHLSIPPMTSMPVDYSPVQKLPQNHVSLVESHIERDENVAETDVTGTTAKQVSFNRMVRREARLAQSDRTIAEQERIIAEKERRKAEVERMIAEKERGQAEMERKKAEQERIKAEMERKASTEKQKMS